jgi:hypothetical protein
MKLLKGPIFLAVVSVVFATLARPSRGWAQG